MSQTLRRSVSLAALMAALIPVAVPQGAGAQTIDYGSLEQLFGEPVTTSATGKPQRATEAPVTMEIITADDIKRSGVTNLPDILRRVVGMDVSRWGTGTADAAVRGYNGPASPRLLVMVDGRQIYMDHYGLTDWNGLPIQLAEIRQVEVVKGPNSALFGFNAVGGVVNIVTFNPLYDDVNNVTTRVGTQSYREISGVTTLKLGSKAGLRLSAGRYDAHEFNTDTDPSDADARSRSPSRLSVNANGLVQLTPDIQLGGEASRVRSKAGGLVPNNAYLFSDYDSWSGKINVTANTGIGLIEASVYQNTMELDARAVTFDTTTRVAKIQDLFKIGTAHSFRLSAEYRSNSLNRIANTSAEVSYEVYSGGAMWDWTINDRLSLVNAVRLDHLSLERSGPLPASSPYTNDAFNQSMTEISFNSGVVYKPTQDDTLRLAVARGIQVPSLFEYGTLIAVNPAVTLYGNPNIDPTVVTNYELAYDRTIADIGGGLRTSLFYQTNESMKYAFGANNQTNNIGDSEMVGIETALRGKVGANWGWKLGYAFALVNDDFESFATSNRNFQDSTPTHKVNAEISYVNGPWDANLFGQYISATEALRSGGGFNGLRDIPASFTLSGKVGYQITDAVSVGVTGMNITQESQRLTSGYPEERRIFLTLSANF